MPYTVHDLAGERLGICVSGGLDSRTIARKLTELGIDVVCVTADLGQPDVQDIGEVRAKMAPCGVETYVVDLKADMAAEAFAVLKAQATYDGGYWNTTGIARAVTVRGVLEELQRHGCTVLSHGATGRGNDQVRFERYTNVLAPQMKVYAPWRDPVLLQEFPGRSQMIDYLNAQGIQAYAKGKQRYSTDANLAGLSHEAEDLESVETPCTIVQPTMGVWPQAAPDQGESVTVRVAAGVPVALNDQQLAPVALLQEANRVAGRHGIGMKNALENRVVGTKSRGVYEAPGMELLGTALAQVYMAVLDRRSAQLFRQLSQLIADQIYDGRYFDPSTRAAQAAIDSLAERATGTVTLQMYKGNLFFEALRDVPHSLYREEDASMEASEGLNPVSSQGFVEVQSVEARALALAEQIRAR